MATIETTTSLAELVTARPARSAVLERFGLDYCCGGQRTLAAAVSEQGLDLRVVVAALDGLPTEASSADWAQLDMGALAEHIVATHHAYLDEVLPRVDALAAKVAGVHGERHPELGEVRRLVAELRADLEPHLRKEERILFPSIRRLALATEVPQFPFGSIGNPITVMGTEHDRAGELLATLREVSGGYHVPDDGCASYQALYRTLAEIEADTHLHVHKENNVLFPAARAAEAALARTGPPVDEIGDGRCEAHRSARPEADEGGDPPCWAHLFEEPDAGADDGRPYVVVADLGATGRDGRPEADGAVWSLPHGGDHDANLVRLSPGGAIAPHTNDLLDVLLVVRSGDGAIVVDGIRHGLRPDVVLLVPRGAHREIAAGSDGLTYLSIHRSRPPLTVGRAGPRRDDPRG
jgi:regulator of cell morphogenesis and NO signaling